MQSYGSFALHFYCVKYMYLQNLKLISLLVPELCPGQSSKCKNEQRAITPKLGNAELQFFCIALIFNEIYLPTKCLVDITCNFRVMSWTKFKV